MAKFYRAGEVFRDLPAGIRENVFRIAAGKLVYFPSNNRREPADKVAVCTDYAEGSSFAEVGEKFRISRERGFRIVADERACYSKARIRFWREEGLSLREIARLFKKSREAVR